MWPQRFNEDGSKKGAADYWATTGPWLRSIGCNEDIFKVIEAQHQAIAAYENGEMTRDVLHATYVNLGGPLAVSGLMHAIAASKVPIRHKRPGDVLRED